MYPTVLYRRGLGRIMAVCAVACGNPKRCALEICIGTKTDNAAKPDCVVKLI